MSRNVRGLLSSKPISPSVRWLGGHGKGTLSVGITAGLLLALLFVPPAQAVSVKIVGLQSNMIQPGSDQFSVEVAIGAAELVPLDSLTFRITGASIQIDGGLRM